MASIVSGNRKTNQKMDVQISSHMKEKNESVNNNSNNVELINE